LRGEQRRAKAEFRKHEKTRFGKAKCLTKIEVFEASNKTESERSKTFAEKLTGKPIKSSSSHQQKSTDIAITC